MPGFTSFDDFINQASVNGRRYRADWQKSFLPTTPAVAGEWHCMARGAGNPPADALYNTGTTMHWQSLSYEAQNAAGSFSGALPYGGVVGANGDGYKVITAAGAWTAAATVAPCILMLVDLLAYVRNTGFAAATYTVLDSDPGVTANAGTDILTNTTLTMLNGTKVVFGTSGTLPAPLVPGTEYWTVRQTATTYKVAATYADAVATAPVVIDITDTGSGTHTVQCRLPRYSDGLGVQTFWWANNATPLGAGTPNCSMSYTPGGTAAGTGSGRATPTVLPIGKTACPNGQIVWSGTGSGKYGWAMPLRGSDRGVSSIETITTSGTYTSGEYSVALARPILQIPVTTLGVPGERNMFSMWPSLPPIYDGANLVWLINSGAATPVSSVISGALEFAWGA